MSLAVITQETFQGRGSLTSGSPGNLGSVNPVGGSAPFIKLAGGPRLNSDSSANSLGWSADLQDTATVTPPTHRMSIPSGNRSLFTFSWGQFVKSLATSGSNPAMWTTIQGNAWGNMLMVTSINPSNGHLCYALGSSGYSTTPTDTGIVAPLRQWTEYRITMQDTNPGTDTIFNILWQYRIYGTSTWVTIVSLTSQAISGGFGPPTAIIGGLGLATGSYGRVNGRYAMPTLLSMGSWSDNSQLLSTLATPVVDCAAVPNITWLWDPANYTGSASDSANDGVTAPYLSQAWIMEMDTYCGVFSPPTGSAWQNCTTPGVPNGTAATIPADEVACTTLYQSGAIALAGDTLQINNNAGAEIRLGNNVLTLNSDGLSITSSGGIAAPANLCFAALVAPSAWSSQSGSIYKATVSSYNSGFPTYGVLMCNRVPMTALTGSSLPGTFTAGTYWANSTIVYAQTASGASPAADGNCYEVCSGFDNTLNGVHKLVRGINIIGTDDRDHTAATQSGRSWLNIRQPNELAIFDTCQGRLWGKHFLANGANNDDSNSIMVAINCIGPLGDAQAGAGGQSIFADNSTTGSGQRTHWLNCGDGGGNVTQSGNPLPATSIYQLGWLCHGAVYSRITLTNPSFGHCGGIGPGNNTPVQVIGGTVLGDALGNAPGSYQTSFTRCTILDPSNLVGVYHRCNIITAATITSNANATEMNAILSNCTWDYSALPATYAAINRGGAMNLSISNSLLIAGSGGNPLVNGWSAGDVLATSQNEIQGASNATILVNWDGNSTLTLAQMQADAIDAGSAMVTAASVQSWNHYARTAQSTVHCAVKNDTDFNGIPLAFSQTVGSTEYPQPGGGGSGGGFIPPWIQLSGGIVAPA